MTPDDRTEWYRKQKLSQIANKRKSFDENVLKRSTNRSAFNRLYAQYHWLPIDEWIIREFPLGNDRAAAIESFKEACEDATRPKRFYKGEYLVGG